jgi:phage protein D
MPDQYAPKPVIEIDGRPAPTDLDVSVERVVVDLNSLRPDMFTLRLRDPDHAILGKGTIKIGTKIKVSAAGLGGGSPKTLLSGEVTALEADFDTSGSHALIRGFDAAHRLHRGRRTETYLNATDSDIARAVAQRAGLDPGRIDGTPTVHKHVSQVKLTDWEFLTARAREIGFELFTGDGKLSFHKPAAAADGPSAGNLSSRNPLQLVLGDDLEVFRPRLSAAGQVDEVQVRGWDPTRKKAVVGSAKAATRSASVQPGPAQLAKVFGAATYVAADRPFSTQAEVDAAADALAEEIGCTYAEAEGIARGNPSVRAGTPISVGLTGKPFEGGYTVTSATHVFDERGYRTHFTVSGRHDRSLLALASNGAPSTKVAGVVIAQVTAVNDREDLGRVKLKFPWLADDYESDWARVVQPGAGKGRGWVTLPEVNDEVLVAFEHGDVRRPYVIGGLFNGVDKPPLANDHIDGSSGAVNCRQFTSRGGHVIRFLDGTDKQGIVIETKGAKQEITLDAKGSRVQIKCDGAIEIEAGKDLKLAAPKGAIEIEAGKDLKLAAPRGGVELKGGKGAIVEGGAGDVTVKGSTIKLN